MSSCQELLSLPGLLADLSPPLVEPPQLISQEIALVAQLSKLSAGPFDAMPFDICQGQSGCSKGTGQAFFGQHSLVLQLAATSS